MADRGTERRLARMPFTEALAEVVLGLLRVYFLEISRRLASRVIERGVQTMFRTEQDEEKDMSAIINREDISKSVAGIGQNSRMAALKVRQAFRSAVKDIRKSAGAHSHEFSTATKGSVENVERYVRKNPLRALLISLGVGLCVGAFVRK